MEWPAGCCSSVGRGSDVLQCRAAQLPHHAGSCAQLFSVHTDPASQLTKYTLNQNFHKTGGKSYLLLALDNRECRRITLVVVAAAPGMTSRNCWLQWMAAGWGMLSGSVWHECVPALPGPRTLIFSYCDTGAPAATPRSIANWTDREKGGWLLQRAVLSAALLTQKRNLVKFVHSISLSLSLFPYQDRQIKNLLICYFCCSRVQECFSQYSHFFYDLMVVFGDAVSLIYKYLCKWLSHQSKKKPNLCNQYFKSFQTLGWIQFGLGWLVWFWWIWLDWLSTVWLSLVQFGWV